MAVKTVCVRVCAHATDRKPNILSTDKRVIKYVTNGYDTYPPSMLQFVS